MIAGWWTSVGKPGADGKAGPAGKDGKDGKAGQDGKAGLPGKDGKDGLAGRHHPLALLVDWARTARWRWTVRVLGAGAVPWVWVVRLRRLSVCGLAAGAPGKPGLNGSTWSPTAVQPADVTTCSAATMKASTDYEVGGPLTMLAHGGAMAYSLALLGILGR